jgi:hypothetical protein
MNNNILEMILKEIIGIRSKYFPKISVKGVWKIMKTSFGMA